MPSMRVLFEDPEEAGKEIGLDHKPYFETYEDWYVNPIEGAMSSGKTAVTVAIPFIPEEGNPNRQEFILLATTSLKMWMQVSTMLGARYKDELDADGVGYVAMTDNAKEVLAEFYTAIIHNAIPSATDAEVTEAVTQMFAFMQAGAPMPPPEVS